jgi:cytochrome bd ubiquinol oxidase subunit II
LVTLPIILDYLGHAYWVFRGKAVLEGGYGTPGADGMRDVGRRRIGPNFI